MIYLLQNLYLHLYCISIHIENMAELKLTLL